MLRASFDLSDLVRSCQILLVSVGDLLRPLVWAQATQSMRLRHILVPRQRFSSYILLGVQQCFCFLCANWKRLSSPFPPREWTHGREILTNLFAMHRRPAPRWSFTKDQRFLRSRRLHEGSQMRLWPSQSHKREWSDVFTVRWVGNTASSERVCHTYNILGLICLSRLGGRPRFYCQESGVRSRKKRGKVQGSLVHGWEAKWASRSRLDAEKILRVAIAEIRQDRPPDQIQPDFLTPFFSFLWLFDAFCVFFSLHWGTCFFVCLFNTPGFILMLFVFRASPKLHHVAA